MCNLHIISKYFLSIWKLSKRRQLLQWPVWGSGGRILAIKIKLSTEKNLTDWRKYDIKSNISICAYIHRILRPHTVNCRHTLTGNLGYYNDYVHCSKWHKVRKLNRTYFGLLMVCLQIGPYNKDALDLSMWYLKRTEKNPAILSTNGPGSEINKIHIISLCFIL